MLMHFFFGGGEEQTRFIMSDMQMTKCALHLIIIINIITSVGQYSLGLVFECLVP